MDVPTRVVCISDTHLKHRQLEIPPCHILIHAGDILQFTRNLKRAKEELADFLAWFSAQPAQHKILIGGNHDLILDSSITKDFGGEELIARYPVIYLANSGVDVTVSGKKLKVWGIPHTDIGMAFNILTPEMVAAIPEVDILITHCPPSGESITICDVTGQKMDQVPGRDGPKHVGSRPLYERVRDIVPTLHVFGHIHGGYGVYRAKSAHGKNPDKVCTFVNASIEQEKGAGGIPTAVNAPVVLDLVF